jgi:hypothetical protein
VQLEVVVGSVELTETASQGSSWLFGGTVHFKIAVQSDVISDRVDIAVQFSRASSVDDGIIQALGSLRAYGGALKDAAQEAADPFR